MTAFGFSGAHRTGKTTLAKAVAESIGATFYEVNTSQVCKDLGYDAISDMTLGDRIDMQEGLLDHHVAQLKSLPRPLITDRTPADFIGYTIAEVGMHGTSKALSEKIDAYVKRAQIELVANYQLCMVVQPLDFYKLDPTSPPENPAYQMHIQMIIEGVMFRNMNHLHSAILQNQNLDQRIMSSQQLIINSLQDLQDSLSSVTIN